MGRAASGKNFWEVWRMLEYIVEMFSYPFMQRAFLVGILVSLCASLLGVSLVLKRYSMIGDGLSHVGFGALAVASALNMAPLAVAVPVVILAAFILLRLSDSGRLKGDAAIAMISTGALAVGVMVVSVTTGMNSDLNSYMFGSILAMSKSDVVLSVVLSVIVLVLYLLFYDKIFAVTFDAVFARATGIRTGLYNMLLAVLTSVTVVLGMRMMGALLISSLIIFPALTAMRVCKRYRSVILCAVAVSVVSFILGMTVSFLLATPAGASIVIVDIVLYFIFWLAGAVRGK
jgi:ABC-type Mn2+/Zn2+ transport system permease subunit